jgi:hemoglobin
MESSMAIDDLYSTIGEAPITRLVAAFYAQVPADDILSPMYPPEDLPGAEQRLRDFLVFRFGGPQHYIEQRGHPRLRMRHAPFQIDQRARDRWMELMTKALDASEFPPDARAAVLEFFGTTATFMINRQH